MYYRLICTALCTFFRLSKAIRKGTFGSIEKGRSGWNLWLTYKVRKGAEVGRMDDGRNDKHYSLRDLNVYASDAKVFCLMELIHVRSSVIPSILLHICIRTEKRQGEQFSFRIMHMYKTKFLDGREKWNEGGKAKVIRVKLGGENQELDQKAANRPFHRC